MSRQLNNGAGGFLAGLLRMGWIGFLLVAASGSQAAEISAQLSRNPVALNESFELIYSTPSAPDAEPDWTPLEGLFEVVHHSRSENIQIINGRREGRIHWTLSLLPRQVGELTIPAIAFGKDRSEPLTLEVTQTPTASSAGRAEDLFLKLQLEPQQAYVQQQVVLSVRLYRAVNIGEATLSAPEQEDLVIKKLGDDTQFETQLEGRRYVVTERRYALYPQRSGRIRLPPVRFQGEVHLRDPGLGRFLGAPFGSRGQVKRLVSEPLELEVLPIPEDARDGAWLPATHVQLAEAWPNNVAPEFRVGEPITRTLLLLADGLTSAQLPSIGGDIPPLIKQYPDQPLLEDREAGGGITGIRQEKMALVPTHAGEFVLPAIEIPWWNLETASMEVARVAERRIRVLEKPGDPTHPPAASEAVAAAVEPPAAATSADAAQDTSAPPSALGQQAWLDCRYWPWIAAALALGWLLSLLLWLRCVGGGKPPRGGEQKRTAKAVKPNTGAVKKACVGNDADAAASALLAWASAVWPHSPPRSLGALAERMDPATRAELAELERVLYAPQRADWQGHGLWQAWRSAQATLSPAQGEEPSPGIAELYPR